MTLFYCLLALAVGLVIGYLIALNRPIPHLHEIQTQLAQRGEQLAAAQQAVAAATTAQRMLQEQLSTAHTNERERQMREHAALKEEIKRMAEQIAHQQSDRLRMVNREEIDRILRPLDGKIAAFEKTFIAQNATVSEQIEGFFKHSAKISHEADQLARALRANAKTQGNWGEGVLRNILEASGLTPGRDYVEQAVHCDAQGRRFIPDVIVHLPEGRAVVIDAKVSLTAFVTYTAAETTTERAAALKDHVLSLRKHIAELSEKQYPKLVNGAIGHVLLFLPSEAAYIAAIEADARLATEAYARGVILLNPSNLLMALQLAYNLWQSERQSQSVHEIYKSAGDIYAKFVNFAETFVKVGEGIKRLDREYQKAEKQLTTGRGNVIRQLEQWRAKGLTPTQTIPAALIPSEEETPHARTATPTTD